MRQRKYTHGDPLANLQKKHNEYLEKYGWVAHFVMDDKQYPNGTNYHTHGLRERYHHLDLQICLPIKHELAHSIFDAAIARIKEGWVFVPNKAYYNILDGGMAVSTIAVPEEGRALLRLILPDENGGYEAPFYREQFKIGPIGNENEGGKF